MNTYTFTAKQQVSGLFSMIRLLERLFVIIKFLHSSDIENMSIDISIKYQVGDTNVDDAIRAFDMIDDNLSVYAPEAKYIKEDGSEYIVEFLKSDYTVASIESLIAYELPMPNEDVNYTSIGQPQATNENVNKQNKSRLANMPLFGSMSKMMRRG
jgi:hypothetical protein